MAHNLTESASFDSPVPVPDDGDDDVAASVNGALQALANRTTLLRALHNGWLLDAPRIRSTDGTHIVLDAIPGLEIGGAVYSTAGTTVVTTSGLANDTPYDLYAYVSGGALAFEVSATLADAATGGIWKTGAVGARRRLCSLRTYPGAADVLPFQFSRGEYLWLPSFWAGGTTPNAVAALTTSTSWTNVNVASLAGTWARTLLVRVRCEGNAGAVGQVAIAPGGQTVAHALGQGNYAETVAVPPGNFGVSPVHSGFAYSFSVIAGSPALTIDVAGWRE